MLSKHDGAVQLVLSDNGTGTDGVVSGIGLQGMTERVNALEGSLTWHSSSYGFTINATMPLSRKDDGQDDSASAG
jgi:signal transduction histidine kinase